jgi:hypothetical protein
MRPEPALQHIVHQTWWYTPVISALGRWKQEYRKIKAVCSYRMGLISSWTLKTCVKKYFKDIRNGFDNILKTLYYKSLKILRRTFSKLHQQVPQFPHLSHKGKSKFSRYLSGVSRLDKFIKSKCFKQHPEYLNNQQAFARKGYQNVLEVNGHCRDGLVVENTGYPPRGPRFNSHHPHVSSQLSVIPVPGFLTHSCRHRSRQNTNCVNGWIDR